MSNLAPSTIQEIVALASQSPIVSFKWADRGKAPLSYIQGIAVVYGSNYSKFLNGDERTIEMSKARTDNPSKDALAWYNDKFLALGMNNGIAGADTLRHLFVLLTGLGMRESSGKHCVGRDQSASNVTAETAEAGLFQTSFNARSSHVLLPALFQEYLANPVGFLEIFQQGVTCKNADAENFGSGPGADFQRLSKICPAFAAEFAAIGLRNLRKHWGPINRKEAQLRPEIDALLTQVQVIVDNQQA